ncbi:MAG: class I SAM-dependent methyltransferase [Pseudomonadales bacterium]
MAGFYERRILPKLIDVACSQPPMTRLRSEYVSRAHGRVLEVGIGTGLNLPHYGSAVTSITGVDPAAELTSKARKRAAAIAQPVDVLGVSGEELPVEDRTFDCVVCTWTLCTIPAPALAIAEMRRVLKPEGELIFVEHGRSDEPGIARWQARIEPLWKPIGGGCHLTRRADELLSNGGFTLTEQRTGYEQGPRIAAFMIHGIATPT